MDPCQKAILDHKVMYRRYSDKLDECLKLGVIPDSISIESVYDPESRYYNGNPEIHPIKHIEVYTNEYLDYVMNFKLINNSVESIAFGLPEDIINNILHKLSGMIEHFKKLNCICINKYIKDFAWFDDVYNICDKNKQNICFEIKASLKACKYFYEFKKTHNITIEEAHYIGNMLVSISL